MRSANGSGGDWGESPFSPAGPASFDDSSPRLRVIVTPCSWLSHWPPKSLTDRLFAKILIHFSLVRSYDTWQEGGVELMAKVLSTSQLNKIGERLRKKLETEDDLRELDQFRVSFETAYQHIFDELSRMGLNSGGRPQKTTPSIVAKLERERTRLSRMQCRMPRRSFYLSRAGSCSR